MLDPQLSAVELQPPKSPFALPQILHLRFFLMVVQPPIAPQMELQEHRVWEFVQSNNHAGVWLACGKVVSENGATETLIA